MGEAMELRIVCSFTIEHVPAQQDQLALDPAAEFLPFAYTVQERLDLEHYLRPHHDDDAGGTLIRWAHQFLHTDQPNSTREVLARMNAHIGQSLEYKARDEEGTQTPLQTLALGSGSCRDYALLMMEAARRLGIATRFVSGYLYDAALDRAAQAPGESMTGAGTTHRLARPRSDQQPDGQRAADPRRRHARSGAGRADLRQLVWRCRGLRRPRGHGRGDAPQGRLKPSRGGAAQV
jgi:transglutaminase-like putative cysteine protease